MLTGNTRPRRMVNGDEVDAYQARSIYCYLQRAGVVRKIKRGTNKRERREGKQEIRTGSAD